MIRRPPRSTRTDTLFPDTTLCRSYYPPDLSARSYRMAALVEALLKCLPQSVEIELLTTQPNRYASVSAYDPLKEHHDRLTVHRIPLRPHRGGFIDQSRALDRKSVV